MWNVNACNAVVAAFNLQGSAWDRSRRQYLTHVKDPPLLETEVCVSDVPLLAPRQRADAQTSDAGGASERRLQESRRLPDVDAAAAVPASWVAVVAGEERLHRLRAQEGIPFRIAGGDTV